MVSEKGKDDNGDKEPTPPPGAIEDSAAGVPSEVNAFGDVLKRSGITEIRVPAILDYCSQQDLRDMVKLDANLWDMGISNVNVRRRIINYWSRSIGVGIPKQLSKQFDEQSKSPKAEKEREEEEKAKAKYSVDDDTGAIKVASTSEKALTWDEAEKLAKNIKKEISEKGGKRKVTVTYVFDDGKVRMAKENEVGGTLDEAKKLKEMAEASGSGTESPFQMDENGKWQLNPKAKVTGVELMAIESIRRAQESGQPVDPIEAMAQSAEKVKVWQETFGGGSKSPDWMSDPAKFIEMIRNISGSGDGDSGLRAELADMKKSLDDMREERQREAMENLRNQIAAMSRDHQQQIKEILERIDARPTGSKTELDIIHDVAHGALEEAKGLRSDVKNVLTSQGLPQQKTVREQETRKQHYRKAIETDQDIEQLGKTLFLEQ